jgi:hypothetical protein
LPSLKIIICTIGEKSTIPHIWFDNHQTKFDIHSCGKIVLDQGPENQGSVFSAVLIHLLVCLSSG